MDKLPPMGSLMLAGGISDAGLTANPCLVFGILLPMMPSYTEPEDLVLWYPDVLFAAGILDPCIVDSHEVDA